VQSSHDGKAHKIIVRDAQAVARPDYQPEPVIDLRTYGRLTRRRITLCSPPDQPRNQATDISGPNRPGNPPNLGFHPLAPQTPDLGGTAI
jgi:hypothetical protein